MAPTQRVDQRLTLPVRSDGALRLAVVADTHSTPHGALLGQLSALRPDVILHAGDIGDLAVLDDLAAVAPVHFVRGNIDVRAPALPDVLAINVVSGERPLLRILLLHIGVNGVRLRADVARLARAEKARVVVCGHSHVPFLGNERDLWVFNPGSAGPRRFRLPIVFGVIDVGAEVRFTHYDCETGAVWSPAAFA